MSHTRSGILHKNKLDLFKGMTGEQKKELSDLAHRRTELFRAEAIYLDLGISVVLKRAYLQGMYDASQVSQ